MRLWRGTFVCLVAIVALLALPGAAPAADPVFEKYKVPTVGGAEINVEVMRPADNPDAPVILTYSPYNTLSETTTPNLANDDLGQRYVERGYARAVADVLGTRNSRCGRCRTIPAPPTPSEPQRWSSRSLSSTRRILPVSVFGRSSTNSITRG